MAESTLSLNYTNFLAEVADRLGLGRVPASWTATDVLRLESCLQSGVRQFYFPPVLPGERVAHKWTFLEPVMEMELDIGVGDYDLSAQVGQLTGDLTFAGEMAVPPIRLTGEGQIRQLRQGSTITDVGAGWVVETQALLGALSLYLKSGTGTPKVGGQFTIAGVSTVFTITGWVATVGSERVDFTPALGGTVLEDAAITFRLIYTKGRPYYAAVRPKATTGADGQRWELMLYPAPDLEYDVLMPYVPNPDALTSQASYPWGGMAHAETVLQSCLAVAEHRVENERGIEYVRFMERLKASADHDRRLRPPFLGRNVDRSDTESAPAAWQRVQYVTYNGVLE